LLDDFRTECSKLINPEKSFVSTSARDCGGPVFDKVIKSPDYAILLAKKDNEFYIVAITYRDEKNIELFNQILSTFKFIDEDETTGVCPATVADIDGNIYNTVKIGEQCWMKENLKVTKNPEGKAITRYCYDNDPKICETDGGLYDWNTAMNGSTIEGAQGICPDGWHVPKDSEWHTLENYLKDDGQTCSSIRNGAWDCAMAGAKLKLRGSSGFKSVFAGYRDSKYGSFYYRGTSASFWSSTESGDNVWYRYLDSGESTVARYAYNVKASGFSVRCLKD